MNCKYRFGGSSSSGVFRSRTPGSVFPPRCIRSRTPGSVFPLRCIVLRCLGSRWVIRSRPAMSSITKFSFSRRSKCKKRSPKNVTKRANSARTFLKVGRARFFSTKLGRAFLPCFSRISMCLLKKRVQKHGKNVPAKNTEKNGHSMIGVKTYRKNTTKIC